MKKIVSSLLFLLIGLGIYSQSIVGTWKMDDQVNGPSIITTFFDFSKNDSLKCRILCKQSAEFGSFTFDIAIPAKYALKGKVLNITSFKKSTTVKLCNVEFSEDTKNLFREVPESEKTIREMLENAAIEMKEEFINSFEIDGDVNVLKLSDMILELSSDSGSLVFTKVMQ